MAISVPGFLASNIAVYEERGSLFNIFSNVMKLGTNIYQHVSHYAESKLEYHAISF